MYMKRAVLLLLAVISVNQTVFAKPTRLSVKTDGSLNYTCDDQTKIKVVYYSLSDASLNFVKLTVKKDGVVTRYTLPQLVSASGARYSSGQDVQWWSKGRGGFLNLNLTADIDPGVACH